VAPAVPPGDEVPGEDEDEPKSRKGLMWTLIAIGVLALAAIVTMLVINGQGEEEPTTAPVPTLSAGVTPEEAEKTITDAGFEYAQAIDQESTEAEGTFTKTDPAGGTEADLGSTVTAFFSAGPDAVVIQDVKGKTQDEARQILEGQGLTVTSGGSEDSKDVAKDAVTRSEPSAGQSVPAGSSVAIFVSSGLVALPELVGDQRETAEQKITDLGLKPVVNEVESDEPEGQVVAQRPNAGSVPQGSEVTIDVAVPRAAETTNVPNNLAGMTEQQALEALGGAGLVPGTRQTQESDQYPAGVVIGSDPRAGTELEVGSQVSLIVSTGPGPSTGGDNGGGPGNGGGNGGGNDG
jgi:serine/threonine-protein kinase